MYNVHFNLITIWPSKCNLNEWVSFKLNNVRVKIQQSEERELEILTKYVLSFIIISPSTLSRLQNLRKIDDTRCCPLFHTFRALGSVSNMDWVYLFAIHLACVCGDYRAFLACLFPCCVSEHLVFGPLTYVIKDVLHDHIDTVLLINIYRAMTHISAQDF